MNNLSILRAATNSWFKTTLKSYATLVCNHIPDEYVGVGEHVGVSEEVGVGGEVGVGDTARLHEPSTFVPAKNRADRSVNNICVSVFSIQTRKFWFHVLHLPSNTLAEWGYSLFHIVFVAIIS